MRSPPSLEGPVAPSSAAAALAPLMPLRSGVSRPVVRGKFLFAGQDKLLLRGVTYGPFRPDEHGCAYLSPAKVRKDFAAMAARGINSVRTYTCPPRWLLDIAAEQGLRVMPGVALAGEQLTTFLDDRPTVRQILARCRDEVRACAGHPALLAYSVGNEIPSTIIRWHGRRRVERFLRHLTETTRENDPGGLVTYVSYPTTEYLQLSFLDFLSYNVYLESRDRFETYLARLQSIADYKPLVMAEIGLDSLRNGEQQQAQSIDWQVRASFAGGCAGVFVFSWTDEWHTGGCDVEDWKFGITDEKRRPKQALGSVQAAYAAAPLPPADDLPRISVVVCTYNGSRTIRDCLEGCARLDYPDYEVIVVNDGSTDGTAAIAREYDVRLINTPNEGLSGARNTGLSAATGQIIAYLDDDARPDAHWLRYLAETFRTSDHVGVGGPNIVPDDDPAVAQCVANAPGGPTHVLITDRLAEHIPGCNMAFRVSRLREIGGFDAQFRIAGDDVDVCWRLQARGWTLGFNPAAVVWHRRRHSVKAYWKQQLNYGRAEAMLEAKWPEKYNAVGHVGWRGRLYGTGSCRGIRLWSSRVYHGVWASSAFQPLCERASVLEALPLVPEWYLMIVALLTLGGLGLVWPPLLACLPLAALAAALSVVQAVRSASQVSFTPAGRWQHLKLHMLTAVLHILQPAARLWGRASYGLTPWRRRGARPAGLPLPRKVKIWSEHWQTPEQRLETVETTVKHRGAAVRRGGAYDLWDLEVRGGFFASARTRMAVESYPRGRQYLCFYCFPTLPGPACVLAVLPAVMATVAAWQHAWWAAGALAALSGVLVLRALGDAAAAMGCLAAAFASCEQVLRGAAAASAPEVPVAEPKVASPPGEREPDAKAAVYEDEAAALDVAETA